MDPDFARQYYESAEREHWWFRGRAKMVENLLADCYVRKPSDLDAFLGIGKILWQCYLEKRARP